MLITVTYEQASRARQPHNLFMLNLALAHLLMTPAAIALEIGILGMLVPFLISISIILFTYIRSQNINPDTDWFVFTHWKLALRRYRLLVISYAVTAGFILLGWLLASSSPDPNMQDILLTVFLRIAIMPVLIMVMINFYLESTAISMATKGEIPDSIVQRFSKFPPP